MYGAHCRGRVPVRVSHYSTQPWIPILPPPANRKRNSKPACPLHRYLGYVAYSAAHALRLPPPWLQPTKAGIDPCAPSNARLGGVVGAHMCTWIASSST